MHLRFLRLLTVGLGLATSLSATGDLLLIMGAPGEADYLKPFQRTTEA